MTIEMKKKKKIEGKMAKNKKRTMQNKKQGMLKLCIVFIVLDEFNIKCMLQQV